MTGDVPQTNNLGKAVSVLYAVGKASGGNLAMTPNSNTNLYSDDINSVNMDFAGYHVSNQAYRAYHLWLVMLSRLR